MHVGRMIDGRLALGHQLLFFFASISITINYYKHICPDISFLFPKPIAPIASIVIVFEI